jgi:hypothetical protein
MDVARRRDTSSGVSGFCERFESDLSSRLVRQRFTQQQVVGVIDREQGNGRSTDGCEAYENDALPQKVLAPVILTRVKEPYQLVRLRIDARDVRSLVTVAPITAQTEVLRNRRPSVLAGDDVIDRKGEEEVLVLVNPAVLTPIAARSRTNARSAASISSRDVRGAYGLWTVG